MKAMVLAAGEGQRLRPYTEHMPKPMLRIASVPVLEYNLRLLNKYGVKEVAINLHYHPEAIKEHFGDGKAFGMSITYSYEDELLGTAGAVKKMEKFFTETFMVLYGDNLTNCDLSRLTTFHKGKGGRCTVALFHRDDVTASGIAELDSKDRILRFVEKPASENVFSHWVSAGIMIMEPSVLKFIPENHPSDFGRNVLPSLIQAGEVYGYRMKEDLWWIDTPKDYERIQTLASRGELQLP